MLEKYEYLQPHKTSNGTYQTICNYRLSRNELIPFYFETPKLKTTSGIVRIDNNYYIDFELQQSGEGGLFYQYLLKNDEHNITTCYQNSKDWFNQVMPLHIVENYYKTPILLRSSGQLPVFRVRLPSHKGNILTEIFNIRKEKVNDISCIQEGDLIVGILEFSGLNFMSQNFAPCYELQKIKIFKDNDFRAIPSGYIFSDTNDKVDINDSKLLSNDKIMEQSVEIKTITSGDDISSRVDNPKKKSFFDIIKETTFKHFLSDDELFMNNNKTITNKKNKKLEQNTKELKEEPIKVETIKLDKNINSNVNYNNDLKISIQEVKDIDLNIDYELDSPNKSSSPVQEVEEDNILEEDNIENVDEQDLKAEFKKSRAQSNEQDLENSNTKGARGAEALVKRARGAEAIVENPAHKSVDKHDDDDESILEDEDEEDNNIDYETLNELEVIVFDE